MRNWNTDSLSPSPAANTFSFYLWGIETSLPLTMHGFRFPRFHSTYEELKQFLDNVLSPSLNCFHSTYEELKPCSLSPFTHAPGGFSFYLWGIETPANLLKYTVGVWFSFYLWGIETLFQVFFFQPRFPFSFYLWGIETPPPPVFLPRSFRFHSTYEELKHSFFVSPSRSHMLCFHSTYEELKQIILFLSLHLWFLFSFYLWGIETVI